MTGPEEKKLASAEHVIIDEFIKDLEATANQVQALLTKLDESKIDFATIKTEFKFITENVKQLSSLIKDGENGSIMTRLAVIEAGFKELRNELKIYISKDIENGGNLKTRVALAEQQLNSVNVYIENIKKKANSKEENNKAAEENVKGKWQLYIAIAGGIFTLMGSILALLMSIFGN